MTLLSKLFSKKKKVLVISGGGVRGFYALGILKALDELGMRSEIKEVYGVSVGAIIGAYRCAGYTAEVIFEKFISTNLFSLDKINFIPKKSLLKNTFLQEKFQEDLPGTFEQLQIPLNIGVTDTKKAKFLLITKGDLHLPILGSMAIPCLFPPVVYEDRVLMDGGLTNNFPVDLARKDHPKNKIIGINLNKFVENQTIATMIDSISLTYEILLRAAPLQRLDLVDYLFYAKLPVKILGGKQEHMKKIYQQGYKDALKMFAKKEKNNSLKK